MTNVSHDPPVDRTLDALLSRTLGSDSLSVTQKRRHRERLGLTLDAASAASPRVGPFGTSNDGGTRVVTGGVPAGSLRDRLELVTVLTVVILVLAGVAVYQTVFSGDGGDEGSIGDIELTGDFDLYVTTGATTGAIRHAPIDRESLDDRTDIPEIELPDRTTVAASADGSTLVLREWEPDPRLPEDTTLTILDGITGDVRASFHPPENMFQVLLSADGSRMVLQTSLSPDTDEPWHWHVYDTSDGSLIGSIQRDSRAGWDELFLSADGSMLYRVWVTPSSATTDPEPLRIYAYDTATGEETGRLELGHIPAGAWHRDPEAGSLMTDLLIPGAALSPDGRHIAIAHANVQVVTLVDVESLTVERTIQLTEPGREPNHWFEREPRGPGVVGRDNTQVWTVFSADGRQLYVYGTAGIAGEAGMGTEHHLGLTLVDLERGSVSARAFEGERVISLTVAPDGESVYTTRAGRSDDAAMIVQRLDARTLDVLAERGFPVFGSLTINPEVLPETVAEPEASDERLYVVTWDGVVVIDASSGAGIYTIDASDPHAALSPDGSRLYVIGAGGHDQLTAFDAATGDELWRTTVRHRLYYIPGTGPSILGVSTDGSQIYVHSYDNVGDFGSYGGDASNIPTWVHAIDAESGEHLFDTEKIPGYCHAGIHSSADSGLIFEICENIGLVRISDADTGEPVDTARTEIGINGAHPSPDGSVIYLVSGSTIRILDNETGQIVDPPALGGISGARYPFGLSALSPDGSLLYVGLDPGDGGDPPVVREIAVFDTATWNEVNRITVDVALRPGVLSVSGDGRYLYASERLQHDSDGKLIGIDIDTGETRTLLVRASEILRVLRAPAGQPVSGTQAPTPEIVAPEPANAGATPHQVEFNRAPDGPAMVLVSEVQQGGDTFGRVTVVDMASGDELFMAETEPGVDASVSPDGATLYVANGWKLSAFDLATGLERWQTDTELRQFYMPGFEQPSTLAVAPKGDRIFVYTRAYLEEGLYQDQYEVPYWLQVVDASTGRIVANTEEIVGCGAARMSFAPDGGMIYVECSTHIQVVAFDVETLETREDTYLPGLGDQLHSSVLYRTAGSVTFENGRTSLLILNQPGENTLSVSILDNLEDSSEDVDLGPGGEGGTVARGSIALLGGDTRLMLGVRTETELIGSTYYGDIDEFRVFDTTTWEETLRIELAMPLHTVNAAVDRVGNALYGARWEIADDNSVGSTVIYRVELSGAVEQAFVREGESVLRMFALPQE